MSILFYLLKSWLIGITIAAPVGPIGMICIRKTLELGLLGAVSVGLGAAIADSVYGIIAATGFTAVSRFLLNKVDLVRGLGGAFLLYLAYKEIRNPPGEAPKGFSKNKHFERLTSEVFFLTLTNPMIILSFIGIFASIDGGNATILESLVMVLGIFLGSMTWWIVLGTSILKLKHKLPDTWIHRIRYLSALILGLFGFFSIVKGIFKI
jgi:putative LysE/RhtB family amino acid efflux pump